MDKKKLLRTIYNTFVLIILIAGVWLVVDHFVHFGDGEYTTMPPWHSTSRR